MLGACSSVKSIPEGEQLIVKQTFDKNNEQNIQDPITLLSLTPVNQKILGFPLKLHVFNRSHPNPAEQFDQWLHKKPKREERLNRWLSKKQVDRLRKYRIDFNSWLKKTGEAPSLVDENKIELTRSLFKQYYDNLGFFNSTIDAQIDSIGPRKAALNYSIKTGEQFHLDSINVLAGSKAIDSLYKASINERKLVPGAAFRVNAIEAERERLIELFRNNGIYDFQQRSIRFKAFKDSLGNDTKIPLVVEIKNAQKRIQDTLVEFPYVIQKIKKIALYVENPAQAVTSYTDSIDYGNVRLYSVGKLKYNPNVLTAGISIQKDKPYSYADRTTTYRYYNELNNFKYPTIIYKPSKEDSLGLDAAIYLSPKEKFSLGFDLDVSHSNIQDVGISLGTSVITRNVFRGAEILEFGIKGTVGSSRDVAEEKSSFFNLFEVGANIGLRIPRLLAPQWVKRNFLKNKEVKTNLTLGVSLQENIGLDRQNFTTNFEYSWKNGPYHSFNFKLADIEFVNNKAINNYFNVYRNSYDRLNAIAQRMPQNEDYLNAEGDLGIPFQTNAFLNAVLSEQTVISSSDEDFTNVSNINERKNRLTANNFIVGSSMSFLKNNQENLLDEDFSQLRIKVEWVGNLLNAALRIGNTPTDRDGNREIFNLAPSQYIKTEANYIKHWQVGTERIFAFRAFTGIALPYGNANSIPFTRSYYGGGANDNRAWNAYRLGPGSSSGINEFNEANFKIALNLEYRYPIISALKGAFFIDAGNIWNVNNNVPDSDQSFNSLGDLNQIAIGTGFGVRYDFDYFVFRLDTAFKTHNPALPKNERWGSELALKKAVFNVGINYPF